MPSRWRAGPGYAIPVVLAVLAVISVLADRGPDRPTPSTAATAPSQPAVVGHGDGEPPSTPAAARTVARRFAAAYLTLIYATARPRAVPDASPALRAQLARNTARIPPAQRGRNARVIALEITPTEPNRAQATATIDDGRVAPWPLPMSLKRTSHGAWQVTSLGD